MEYKINTYRNDIEAEELLNKMVGQGYEPAFICGRGAGTITIVYKKQ